MVVITLEDSVTFTVAPWEVPPERPLASCKFITEDRGRRGTILHIFPQHLAHVDMKKRRVVGTIVSAGFIACEAGGLLCHGKSTSIKPNPPAARAQDTRMVRVYASVRAG